jgi:hypothetical protein
MADSYQKMAGIAMLAALRFRRCLTGPIRPGSVTVSFHLVSSGTSDRAQQQFGNLAIVPGRSGLVRPFKSIDAPSLGGQPQENGRVDVSRPAAMCALLAGPKIEDLVAAALAGGIGTWTPRTAGLVRPCLSLGLAASRYDFGVSAWLRAAYTHPGTHLRLWGPKDHTSRIASAALDVV